MNPEDAASTAGIIRKYGCTWIDTASAAAIGIIIVAIVTFEATSDSSVTTTQIVTIISTGGQPPTNDSSAPAHFEKPLDSSTSASANPPPKRISTSHGIRLNSDQSSSRWSSPTGIRNAIAAISTATVASLISFPFGKRLDHPGERNIHSSAVMLQRTSAVFSARDHGPGRSMPSVSSGTAAPLGARAVVTTMSQQIGMARIR